MKKGLKKQIAKLLILAMVVFYAFPAFAEETVPEEMEISVEETIQEAEAVEDEAILEKTDVYAEECETLEVDEETTQEVVDTQKDDENSEEQTETSEEEQFEFNLQDILGAGEEPLTYGLYINGTPATADNAIHEIVPRYERENCDGTYQVSVDDNGNYYATLNNAQMLGYGNNTLSCIYFCPEDKTATLTIVFDGYNIFDSGDYEPRPSVIAGSGNVDIKTTPDSDTIETDYLRFANVDGNVTVDAELYAISNPGVNIFDVSGDLIVLGNSQLEAELFGKSAFCDATNLTIDSASITVEESYNTVLYAADTITIENDAYVDVSTYYPAINKNAHEAAVTAGTINIKGGEVQVCCYDGFALSACDSIGEGVLDISGDAKVKALSDIDSGFDSDFAVSAVYAKTLYISSEERVEFIGFDCSAIKLSELTIGSADVNIFMTGYHAPNQYTVLDEDDEETGAIETLDGEKPIITTVDGVALFGSEEYEANDIDITVPVEFVEYETTGTMYSSYVNDKPARSILIKKIMQGEDPVKVINTVKPILNTGKPGRPVSDGIWKYNELTGTWTYTTTEIFKNTWAYIVNPLAPDGQEKASWFYFDREGNMLTGWQWITWNGVTKCYYLNPEHDGTYGACLLGPGYTPDGHEIDESGALVVNGEVQILHMSRS